MEDSDEAVADGAEGLVVEVFGSAVLVVVGACAWAAGDRAERPLVDSVVEPAVADVAGQHGAFFARRDCQRGGSSVVFARLGGGVASGVVPELTEHPGAEHNTKSWQGAVDVGVRVCLKMCRQFGFQIADLVVELDDDADCGAGGRRERGADRGSSGELLATQNFLDL